MIRNLFICLLLTLLVSCAWFQQDPYEGIPLAKDVTLAEIFTDHMVLQSGQKCTIWGKAAPGGKVKVRLGDETVQTLVRSDRSWKLRLAPHPAGGPHIISVTGRNTITLNDILFGEVWICSGQSNMEWPVVQSNDSEAEIAAANFKNIRLFTVKKDVSEIPVTHITSEGWQICSPQTVVNFSAVAYFFGRDLHQNLDIPVGLIHTSWGGTPAEAWTSRESLRNHPNYKEGILALESRLNTQAGEEPYTFEKWLEFVQNNDEGLDAWMASNLDESDWRTMEVPGLWESGPVGQYDGIVWFRKSLHIPESWSGQTLTLHLGSIDDLDSTYVNGKLIGSEEVYNVPREYTVPPELTESCELKIAVRVVDWMGGGGFWGEPESMRLKNCQGDSILLSGAWLYKEGIKGEDVPLRPSQSAPTMLFNAMINPIVDYGMRGVIWYQGEANAGRAFEYRSLFPMMIEDWRKHWNRGDFPFYFVQLANFMAEKPEPSESAWAELRDAQLFTLNLPNTGMACIIDIGESDDIHPRNKQDVGKRLALIVRHHVFGEKIAYSGPMYRSMTIEDNRIRLSFDHVDGGLLSKNGSLTGFAIAGSDRQFVWASAKIEGETVLLSSSEVQNPVAARYAWADNPKNNLVNKAGLPASPFRTDDWPGLTQPR